MQPMPDDALAAFEQIEKIVHTAPVETLASVISQLHALHAIALARLIASSVSAHPPAPEEPDKLLTAEQAAPLLGITPEQLRRRRSLHFRRVVGRRTLRFSERAITRWLARKNP